MIYFFILAPAQPKEYNFSEKKYAYHFFYGNAFFNIIK